MICERLVVEEARGCAEKLVDAEVVGVDVMQRELDLEESWKIKTSVAAPLYTR